MKSDPSWLTLEIIMKFCSQRVSHTYNCISSAQLLCAYAGLV